MPPAPIASPLGRIVLTALLGAALLGERVGWRIAVDPDLGVLLGFLFFAEVPGPAKLGGAALIVLGTVLTRRQ